MKKIDINVDVAEGFAFDQELLRIATSANVCCGAHAGSTELTRATITKCNELGVRIGAHVAPCDRESMGRAPVKIESAQEANDLADELVRQVELAAWSYIKPHGWLYSASTRQGAPCDVVKETVRRTGLPLLGLPMTFHADIADKCGVRFLKEGFADRRYEENGLLVPRSTEDAVLSDYDEIAEQVLRLAPRVDSICVHGDTTNCVEIARLVRSTLESNGYEVETWR